MTEPVSAENRIEGPEADAFPEDAFPEEDAGVDWYTAIVVAIALIFAFIVYIYFKARKKQDEDLMNERNENRINEIKRLKK